MSRAPRSDAVRNRQKLVEAARIAFTADGLSTSLEAIAANAGVSIGTLYNHFGDRDGLIEATVGEALSRMSSLADDAALIDDPWDSFEALIVGICELQASDRAVADILGSRYPATGEVHAACDHLLRRFIETIDRAKLARRLRPDFTVEDLGPIMWSNARIVETDNDPAVWRRHLLFILDGLRQPRR